MLPWLTVFHKLYLLNFDQHNTAQINHYMYWAPAIAADIALPWWNDLKTWFSILWEDIGTIILTEINVEEHVFLILIL